MASRSDSKTTRRPAPKEAAPKAAPPRDPARLRPDQDIIRNRLRQARASLIVLQNGYDDGERNFTTTPWFMRDALEAVQALIEDALAADDAEIDARLAAMKGGVS